MNQDKVTKLVLTLNKSTKFKNMMWIAYSTPSYFLEGTDDVISVLYLSEYKEKEFALYVRKYKYYYDEHEYVWAQRICLAVINDGKNIIWETDKPEQPLSDLYATVTEQASGIDDLLDDLLNP